MGITPRRLWSLIAKSVVTAPLSYRAIVSTLFTTAMYALLIPGSIGAGAATLVKYVGHGATLSAAVASAHLAMMAPLAAPVLFVGGHMPLFGRLRSLPRLAQSAHAAPRLQGSAMLRGFVSVLEQCAQAGSLRAPATGAVFLLSLLILLPISISGLGVREGALILASRPYGVDAAHALSWGLVQFGGALCIALIGGLIEARALWLPPRAESA